MLQTSYLNYYFVVLKVFYYAYITKTDFIPGIKEIPRQQTGQNQQRETPKRYIIHTYKARANQRMNLRLIIRNTHKN